MILETAWRNEQQANGFSDFFAGAFTDGTSQAGTMSFCACVEFFLMSTTCSLFFATPATLENFWLHVTKLMLLKTGETLNPRLLVRCLVFECCSAVESERRAFAVKSVAKYVEAWSNLVHLLEAKSVRTGLN